LRRKMILLFALFGLAAELAFAQTRSTERIATPFFEASRPVELELIVDTPSGTGPFPTIVFNHGSTGRGANPLEIKQTYAPEFLARFFTERGWLVVFPQRRGRGHSDGLYDEGLALNRRGYTCDTERSLAGLERAIDDLKSVTDFLAKRSDVDQRQMVIAGVSRGGILALAIAAKSPGTFVGAINFVGGWIDQECVNSDAINGSTFREAAAFKRPTIWLYGEIDSFYSIEHSRRNFDAFRSAGGQGAFHVYQVGGHWGHYLLEFPELWRSQLSTFLEGIKL
jgi:pimeloyl-ACP methyl ester carboxylesterase